MANKKLLSIAAASVLVATFTMTGCGSSSSAAPVTKNITVSDGYVLGATVTATDYTGSAVELGKGVYQFPKIITGAITATGGVNDVNNDGVKNAGEPKLPPLKAPASYSNINTLTTLLVDSNITAAQLATLLGVNLSDVNNNFDIDVVSKAKTNPKLARGTALYAAVISQVNYNIAHPSSSSSSTASSSSTGILPGTSSASSVSSVASSVASSSSVSGSILPMGILPGDTASSSSTGSILPGASSSSSSVSSVASSVASSSSSAAAVVAQTLSQIMGSLVGGGTVCTVLPTLCTLDTALKAVSDANITANGMTPLDTTTGSTLGTLNGVVPAASSSSSSVASSVSSSTSSVASSAASSSSTGILPTDTPPSPGAIPTASSSSAAAVSSATSSATSSVSGGVLPN